MISCDALKLSVKGSYLA